MRESVVGPSTAPKPGGGCYHSHSLVPWMPHSLKTPVYLLFSESYLILLRASYVLSVMYLLIFCDQNSELLVSGSHLALSEAPRFPLSPLLLSTWQMLSVGIFTYLSAASLAVFSCVSPFYPPSISLSKQKCFLSLGAYIMVMIMMMTVILPKYTFHFRLFYYDW